MRMLVVEREPETAQSLELMIRADGVTVTTTDLAEEALDLARRYDYDLVLLGDAFEDMSGLDLVRAMRRADVRTPAVVLLTRSTSAETVVAFFRAGADDAIPTPFHRDVLVERIRAVIRRAYGHAVPVFRAGSLEVDFSTKTARVSGARVNLTRKEYQMLELMCIRSGVTITKEMFMNHLYGGMDEPELKIIDVFLCKLRKKLGAARSVIETVWGRGYVLRLPEDAGVAA